MELKLLVLSWVFLPQIIIIIHPLSLKDIDRQRDAREGQVICHTEKPARTELLYFEIKQLC